MSHDLDPQELEQLELEELLELEHEELEELEDSHLELELELEDRHFLQSHPDL